jgi:hypothetical protein
MSAHGSLLVADDTGGTIWRISYTGARRAGAPLGATGSVQQNRE